MSAGAVLLTGGGAALLGLSGYGLWSSLRPATVTGIPVLRYRIVGPPRPGSPLNEVRVPMSVFEGQVRHLARRGHTAVTLSQAAARRKDEAFLASSPVAFVFDGPYRSFVEYAWPALREVGFGAATLLFPPKALGQAQLRFRRGRPEPVLLTETLARLAREGVEIGLHAAGLDPQSDEEIQSELVAGRAALAAIAAHEIKTAAVPFSTPKALRALKRAGFTVIAAAGDGILERGLKGTPLTVPCFPIQPDTSILDMVLVVSRRIEGAVW
ncbi:MAG: polysaccharide deacetylase family protein [Planctomycetes bacterium]|nr:polysaccharide deacetylase family protein [Planctomycetota bacterium]